MLIVALIFDFDGVILDTEMPFFLTWQEVYEEHGFDLSLQDWGTMLGSSSDPEEPYQILEEKLGRSLDRAALKAKRSGREMDLLRDEGVLPGVKAILKEAQRLELKLAVASSSERSWVETHLTQLGLLDMFDCVKCAEDVECTKPHPDLYLAACRDLGVHPNQAIAFEDTLHGVMSAKKAGIYCVAIPNQITRHQRLDAADVVVDSLEDVDLGDLIGKVEDQ
jgi:HAD superfamily hydrolase (TIGR01509 family)